VPVAEFQTSGGCGYELNSTKFVQRKENLNDGGELLE
jgi:hypothetical protein